MLDSTNQDSQNTVVHQVTRALGSVANLAYSPPHDYPMSVPAFRIESCAERVQPDSKQLRLYVHIPFCNYGCTYCYFAKRVGDNRDTQERYVNALKQELEWVEPGTPLSQLFMGGGTPTVLPADLLDEVLSAIFTRMPCDGSKVHTVETSPESITQQHIDVLQHHKIGRVSMGIQSLDEQVLSTVHRRHTADQALEAAKLLVDNGFITNIDLMYGLPGQTHESFRQDLEKVASQGIHSVTLYDLRINEKTTVSKAIDDDQRWNLERHIQWRAFVKKAAEDLGFTQTRWHTFKRMDGKAAQHERAPCFNDNGMGYQLGIGMGARSQLGYSLYRNSSNFKAYLERIEGNISPVEDVIPLSIEDRKTQFIARSLGDGKPLERGAYQQAFERNIDDDFGDTIQRLIENGLVSNDTDKLYLTEIGKLVYDLVTVSFYPQSALKWLEQQEKPHTSPQEHPVTIN